MPSASSVKTDKVAASQEVASSESSTSNTNQQNTPIRQAIVIIEHKIRNLDKRKAKLETYRELERIGKDLNQDQKVAVKKFDEVSQTLDFARDLCKQFHNIVTVSEKEAKKLARKEELARRQQDLAKVREVLLIQDALAQMGAENVREDFLLGRNGATQIMAEDLQLLDDLYILVSPKHATESEEVRAEFPVQVQHAAEHLLAVADARQKDFNGSTYAHVKQIIDTVHSSGYLDKPLVAEEEAAAVVATTTEEWNPAEVATTEIEEFRNVLEHTENVPIIPDVDRIPDQMPPMPNFPPVPDQIVQQAVQVIDHAPPPTVANAAVAGYYQAPVVQAPPAPQPQLRPINEMLETGSFYFLQESELDTPPELMPSQAHPTIPSQTFTNQNFTNVVPQQAAPVAAVQVPPPFVTAGAPNLPPPIPMPPSHVGAVTNIPPVAPQPNPPNNTFNSQDFDTFNAASNKPDVETNSVVHDHNNGGDWADQSVMLEERHPQHQHHPNNNAARPPRGNGGGGNRNRSTGGGYYQNNYYQNNGYGNNGGSGGYKQGGGRQGGRQDAGNHRQGGGGQRSNGPGGNKGGDRGSGQYSRNKPQH